MTMKAIVSAIVLAIALPADSSAALTLLEAVRLASERSPSVHAAMASRQIVEAKEQEVKGGAYPQLSLSAGGFSLNMFGGSLGPLAGIGAQGSFGGLSAGNNHLGQLQASATQVLYDAGRIGEGLKVARYSQQAVDLEILQARRKAQYDAAMAFMNALKAERLEEVARAAVTQAEDHVALAESRLKGGVGTRFEVLQAETHRSNATANAMKAHTVLAIARLSLETAVGEPLQALERETTIPGEPPTSDPEAALSQRPELRQLRLKHQIDETAVAIQEKGFMPTVAGMGSYTYQPGGSHYYLVGATLQWALFNGEQTRARVSQAQGELAKDRHQLEGLRRSLQLEAQSALLTRDEAHARLATYEQSLRSASEAHRLAQVRYRAGMGTGSEVIDAQLALVQGRSNLVVARYDAQIAELRLAQAMGKDLDSMLATKGSRP